MRHHALVGLVCSLILSSVALGTGMTSWGMFSEEDFRPEIGENDLRVIVTALLLSDDERKVVQDLHDAHIGRVRDEGAQVRLECADLIERVQLLGDGGPIKDLTKKRDEWRARRESLDKEFVDELRLILSAEQEARWSIVERELRRMKGIPDGRMLGESIDVIDLSTDLEIDAEPEVHTILERYAREIDAALRARESAVEDAAELQSVLATDPQQALRLFEKVRAERIRVRDLNLKAMSEIEQRVGGDVAERIRTRRVDGFADRLSLKDSFALQVLNASEALESLSESQRAQVHAMIEKYTAARDAWMDKYIETAMHVEETAIPGPIDRAIKGEPTRTESYSMSESKSERTKIESLLRAWETRLDLEKRTRAQALALLTPEQRTHMPLLIGQVAIRYGDLYGTDDYLSP